MADEQYISKHTGEEIDAAVDKATLVIANPKEEATEELTKINIDNTIFSLAAGGSGGGNNVEINSTDPVAGTANFIKVDGLNYEVGGSTSIKIRRL